VAGHLFLLRRGGAERIQVERRRGQRRSSARAGQRRATARSGAERIQVVARGSARAAAGLGARRDGADPGRVGVGARRGGADPGRVGVGARWGESRSRGPRRAAGRSGSRSRASAGLGAAVRRARAAAGLSAAARGPRSGGPRRDIARGQRRDGSRGLLHRRRVAARRRSPFSTGDPAATARRTVEPRSGGGGLDWAQRWARLGSLHLFFIFRKSLTEAGT
jgi:hypothetical protein